MQRCDHVKWLKLAVEQRLKDQFLQKWHCSAQSMTSCDLHCQLKNEFKFEKYLLGENVRYSQAICTFGVSNNKIPKITGGYRSLWRNKRFCTLCNDNYLEDEYHVLFERKNTSTVDSRRKYM